MDIKQIDDNLIIEMASGNKDAFKELYGLTADTVYGFALSILRSREDAEDVMHDAFIKIYTGASSYVPSGKPLAWILKIVRNLAYNKMRDEGRTVPVSAISGGGASDNDSTPEHILEVSDSSKADTGLAAHSEHVDDIEEATNRMVLETALAVLEPDECQIVTLHALTGYKHKEIAELLGMPQGTVLSKYNRALKKMRIEIEGKEGA